VFARAMRVLTVENENLRREANTSGHSVVVPMRLR
jgi:hypothetical protein